MSKQKKGISGKEMQKKTGLTRKQMTDALRRVCEIYDFEWTDFKANPLNEKSDFWFPLEYAELLAVLLRHIWNNPIYRKNADLSVVTASAISKFDEAILNDIDNKLPEYFQDKVYSHLGHMTSLQLSDWAQPFVRELTHFMLNLTNLQNEDIGSTLRRFTKKINMFNYFLYRGYYVQRFYRGEKINEEFHDAFCDKFMNVNIDRVLVDLIKEGIEESDFNNYDSEEEWEGGEEQIEEYYKWLSSRPSFVVKPQKNRHDINVMRGNKEKWKPIDEKIGEGSFEGSNLVDQFRWNLEEEIIEMEEMLASKKSLLEDVKKEGKIPQMFCVETDEMIRDRLLRYIEHCNRIDVEGKKMYDVVNTFVGQALCEVLK